MSEGQGEREARLAHICDLMRGLAWKRGKTGPELAAKWGCSLSTVEHLAAEASKRVKAEILDPDRVAVTAAQALEQVLEDALTSPVSDQFRRRDAIAAAKALAELAGAGAPQRSKVTLDASTGLLEFLGGVLGNPPVEE